MTESDVRIDCEIRTQLGYQVKLVAQLRTAGVDRWK